MSNYPPGAELDSRAPWKEDYITVPVKITVIMSYETEVEVSSIDDLDTAVESLALSGELDDLWNIEEISYE